MAALFLKAAAAAILATVCATFFRRENRSFSMLLSIAACFVILVLLATILEPILTFSKELAGLANLDMAYLRPVFKCVGIAIIVQVVAPACRDAGETAIAATIELCASVVALYLSLPLLSAVIQMIKELMGA